jgi:hypothetical protein
MDRGERLVAVTLDDGLATAFARPLVRREEEGYI